MLQLRVGGILGIAVTWALFWGLVGGLFYAVAAAISGSPVGGRASPLEIFGAIVSWWGLAGGSVGLAFGIALMVAERRTSLSHLSMRHTAFWGAIGGAAFPVLEALRHLLAPGQTLWPRGLLTATIVFSALGSLSAAATLALARRWQTAISVSGIASERLGAVRAADPKLLDDLGKRPYDRDLPSR